MIERSHYARGEEDGLIVAQGGLMCPAEIAPRELAALLRIEDEAVKQTALLTEIRDLLAASAPKAPKAKEPKPEANPS